MGSRSLPMAGLTPRPRRVFARSFVLVSAVLLCVLPCPAAQADGPPHADQTEPASPHPLSPLPRRAVAAPHLVEHPPAAQPLPVRRSAPPTPGVAPLRRSL